jgi:pimeloyl-ACP methyl ester carboxylesterase
VLLDPRGTGNSDPPIDGRYELADYAADLEELRLHLGLEQFDLLGHSHGGFVGLIYATSFPNALGRLVLACTAPRFSPELSAEWDAAVAAHGDEPWFADSIEAQERRRAWDFGSSEEAAGLYAREARLWFGDHGPDTEAFLVEFGLQRPCLDALRYFNERLAPSYDLRPVLGRVAVPTLVINGEADFFGPIVSARELGEIPGARVTILPGAGHFPWVDAREQFQEELNAFLELTP